MKIEYKYIDAFIRINNKDIRLMLKRLGYKFVNGAKSEECIGIFYSDIKKSLAYTPLTHGQVDSLLRRPSLPCVDCLTDLNKFKEIAISNKSIY